MKNTKKIYIVVQVVLLVMFALSLFWLLRGCKQKEQQQDAAKIEAIKMSPVQHYRDAGDIEHAEKQVAEATYQVIQLQYKETIDSLSRLLKVKDKAIRDITIAGTITKGTFRPSIDTHYVYVDRMQFDTADDNQDVTETPTGERYFVHYKDKWLEMSGWVDENDLWRYQVSDSLTFVTYYKRKGLFKKQLYIDGFAQNPNTHIKGLTGIKIQERIKRFGIGWNVSYSVFPDGSLRPSVGVGLHYNLIRF